MASSYESYFEDDDDDLQSEFDSVFQDDAKDDTFGGAKLTRKKSGVKFKEKPGLKKKPSMRELRKRKANSKGGKGFSNTWKNELKKLNSEIESGTPSTEEEEKLEEAKVKVVSVRINKNNGNQFDGKWESEEASMDTLMGELSVGAAFRRLASKFGGTPVQKLLIKQDGNHFDIVESNERRDVFMSLNIDEKFESASERGEKLECIANWDNPQLRKELIIEFYNVETEEKSLVRRSVSEDRMQLFEVKEDGNGKELHRRTYNRKITQKDLKDLI